MAINERTRDRLLRLARDRCCLHRFNWLHRPAGPRWETLHIHHVVFQSLGGTDELDNLIPLCPACHDFVHKKISEDDNWLTVEKLKAVWENWKELPQLVGGPRSIVEAGRYRGAWPNFAPIIPGESTRLVVQAALRTYGLNVSFEAYGTENYKDFRTRIVEDLFQSVSIHDKWCPFSAPTDKKWDSFRLSCDPMVWVTNEWNQFTVEDIVARHPEPIVLEAPAFMVFRADAQVAEAERLSRVL